MYTIIYIYIYTHTAVVYMGFSPVVAKRRRTGPFYGTMGFFFSDFEVTSKKALNNHRTSEQTSTTGSQRREDQKVLLITVVGFFEWDNELFEWGFKDQERVFTIYLISNDTG